VWGGGGGGSQRGKTANSGNKVCIISHNFEDLAIRGQRITIWMRNARLYEGTYLKKISAARTRCFRTVRHAEPPSKIASAILLTRTRLIAPTEAMRKLCLFKLVHSILQPAVNLRRRRPAPLS